MLFEHKTIRPLRNVLKQRHEDFALVVGRVFLAHELHDHQAVLDLHALHAQADGLPAQAHDVEQLPGGLRQRPEAVDQAVFEGLEGLLVLRRIKLAVELQALGLLRDIILRERRLDLDLDVRVVDEAQLLDDLLLAVAHGRSRSRCRR